MGLGNIPGISNGDGSPISTKLSQETKSGASGTGGQASNNAPVSFTFGAAPVPGLSLTVILVVGALALVGTVLLRKKG